MLLTIRRAARRIRHMPSLQRQDWLWNALRPAYLTVTAVGGGIPVCIGGTATVRMPAEFVARDWETYEPETAQAVAMWARNNPHGLFLDIGSSVGVFSAVAMFAGRDIEAVAFDSDLPSLAACYRLCRYAPGRLRTVHGFVTQTGKGLTLEDAELIDAPATAAEPTYINLGTRNGIPENAIDDLFRGLPVGRPILLKCDIEGAELLMLRGAANFIAAHRPTLLLSIHPNILPDFGHSADDVRAQLTAWRYSIDILAIDHEEHWWCVPQDVKKEP